MAYYTPILISDMSKRLRKRILEMAFIYVHFILIFASNGLQFNISDGVKSNMAREVLGNLTNDSLRIQFEKTERHSRNKVSGTRTRYQPKNKNSIQKASLDWFPNSGDELLPVAMEYTNYGLKYPSLTRQTGENTNKQFVADKRKRAVPSLSGRCLANCYPLVPASDVENPIEFNVVCEQNCESLDEAANPYLWTIKNAPDFDYDRDTESGRYSSVFTIKPNVFKPGIVCTVEVEVLGHHFYGSHTILTHAKPKLRSCEIQPQTGEASKTQFFVNCDFDEGSYTFKLYSVKNDDSEFLLSTGDDLSSMPIMLNENVKVKVKIIDKYQYTDSKMLDVTVVPTLQPPRTKHELVKEIEDKYFSEKSNHSINRLLGSKDHEELLQVLNVLTEELSELPKDNHTETTIKEYNIKMLDILKGVPLVTKEMAKQVAVVSSKIATQYEEKSDPDIAEMTTQICEEASKSYLKYVQREEYPKMLSEEVERATEMFAGCSRGTSGSNLEILDTGDKDIVTTTTAAPPVDFPLIEEDYPDYVDDQNLSKILTKFQTATEQLVRQCFLNSKTIALSMVVQDDTKIVGTDKFQISATKKRGRDIPLVNVSSQNVYLFASKDFFRYTDKEISVLLCTFTKNPFWWIRGERIPTTIAMLAFTNEGKVISNFVRPFSISFKNNEGASTIKQYTGTTPNQPNDTQIQEIYDFERMTMFRIDVFRNQGYVIEFSNLPPDNNLNVYVSDFFKPTRKDFMQQSIKVNATNSKMFIEHDHDYDVWHYMCVLPEKEEQILEFNFSVYTMSCFQWDSSVRNWVFSCGMAETSTVERFDCLCYHSSVLAGRIRNNNLRKENSTAFIVYEMELQTSLIIFISVAVAFFIYCVLLMYITIDSRRQTTGKSIYFLSDIPSSYQFGYLLIVKTGRRSNSGTTSNVVFKVYGKSSESKAHVLNFPDPEKRILQRDQEDWFFLATEFYLGEIEKMEIWFDSLGFKPSWYCSEVEVFDLQKNKYWLFNIGYRFEISNKEKFFLTAYPESEQDAVKKRFSLKKFTLQGCHFWNIFQDDEVTISRTKRLTIMLSIFMTTYALILLFYGCPMLKNSDSLGHFWDFSFHAIIFWYAIAGFTCTFLIHWPIVYFFRFYDEEGKDENKIGFLVRNADKLYLACWGSLVFLIISTMTALLVLGYWVPHVTALLWLTSTITSLLVYIFLIENCVRLIYKFTMKKTTRVFQILRRIKPAMAYIEAQRALVFREFGQVSLRPYYRRLYRPMGPSRIRVHKHWAQIKENLLEIIEDLVMITIYVMLLYMVILTDKDPLTYVSNREAKDLVTGIHSRTNSKKLSISNRKEIQEYITNTIIFSTQSLQWYGKFISNDPGMTIDNSNKYIGIARLRQLRSDNHSCTVVASMKFLWHKCIPEFSDGPEYGDYSEGWEHDNKSDQFARMDSVWNYNGYSVTGSFSYVGKFATYPGGGYLATLGRTMKNSLINTNYIYRNKWIDRRTRCLFIEFLLYNANSNLFQSVLVKFEISPTGYVRSMYNVYSARLLFVKGKSGVLLWVVMALFVLIVIILLVKLLMSIVKKRKMVFSDLWYIVDISIVAISIVCLILFMERSSLVKSFMEKIELAKHNEFVNYFHLFFAESTLTSLAALLVFMATLRLWKLLKFLMIIKIAEKTLSLSLASLICILLYHMLTIFLFTLIGLIFFGDQSFDFKDILDSIVTLVLLSLHLDDNFDFGAIRTHLHHLYYCLYMLVSLYYLTLYVAIITICFHKAQIHYSTSVQGYTVFDYLREQYQYYKGVAGIKFKRSSLRGGAEDSTPVVVPKSDEHRYARCLKISKNRMNAMMYAALGVLRGMKKSHKLTPADEDLIKMIIVNFFRTDIGENEYFFLTDFLSKKAKLVDDLKLVKMEKVLTIILSKMDRPKEKLHEGLMERNKKKIEEMTNNLTVLSEFLDRLEIKAEL